MSASDPITTTEGLQGGDILMVAVQLTDKTTRQPYWWKRFVAVIGRTGRRSALCLTLKMQIDEEKDIREVFFDRDVVTKVEESAWPQGVVAMRTKWIMKRVIPLGELT